MFAQDGVCAFWARQQMKRDNNKCKYGSKCKYEHGWPSAKARRWAEQKWR